MGLLLEEDVIIFPGQDIEVLVKPEYKVEGKEDEGTEIKKTKKKNKKKKKPSKGTLAAAGKWSFTALGLKIKHFCLGGIHLVITQKIGDF